MILRILSLILCTVITLHAQEGQVKGSFQCSQKKSLAAYAPSVALGPSTPRHSFDVLNYTLELDIYNCFLSPYPKSYVGKEVITFLVDSTLNSVQLNAVNTSLVIDSVGLAGVSFTHTNNILTITLDRTYDPGEVVDITVAFRHNNVTDNAFYASNGMVFTDCEPEGARKWFPCWDRPSDKATLDLTAKVPSSVKLGSNGRLADSTTIADTTWYRWISRDPIATYLMVMSGKVNYNIDIVHWRLPSNPNDSIPIRFYWNAGENTTSLNNIKTKIIPMTDQFSLLFGEYPFEKNGFATLNSQFPWGGMENQTLTSLCANCWNENLVSHEHAHQWFGDMISPGTWADIWLNEGFATFSEALWYEYTGGPTAYKNDILGDASSYLSGNPGWPIYNPQWAIVTPPNSQLFNYAITYAKSACVLHLLRYTLGDSLFFAAIKAYAMDTTNFKHKSAVTADFITTLNQVTGESLNWFFDQWVYQPNHPVYQNTYNINALVGSQWMLGFRFRQTQTNTVFFKMPAILRVTFSSGPDTLLRVMNNENDEVFEFLFSRQPTSVAFDPTNEIVLKSGTTGVGQTLVSPVLLFPENGGVELPLAPTLVWRKAMSAVSYTLQVATDSLFSSIVFQDTLSTDTTLNVPSLGPNTTYYWRVQGRNSAGSGPWSSAWHFTTTTQVSVANGEIPRQFLLLQNRPNPFNPATLIGYDVAEVGLVSLKVYDILGREVATLVNEEQTPGEYEVQWNAGPLASGVYFYRLEVGNGTRGFSATRAMFLLK